MNILDNKNKIKEIDIDDIYHSIIHMPEQVQKAYFQANIFKPEHFQPKGNIEIKRILIVGMGGSAISADIIKSLYSDILPIDIIKDYWPTHIDSHTLVIACSYSGNTEETINFIKEARKHTKNLAAITTGGKLKELFNDKNLWVEMPKGFQPRAAIAYQLISLIKILESHEIIDIEMEEIKDIIVQLSQKAASVCIANPEKKNLAKQTARLLLNKIPLIYSISPSFEALAYRWKCQINENAKNPAFSHTFPEMNHNEIEGWEDMNFKDTFYPIFLNKFEQNPIYQKRLDAFKKLLDKNSIQYSEFFSEGDSMLKEYFNLIYLGDIISYYLAILKKVDPSKIEFINFLKNNI